MSQANHFDGHDDSNARITRETLDSANIIFEKSSAVSPPPASALIAQLSHWPWPYADIDETAIQNLSSLSEDDRRELLVAVESARLVREDVLERCIDRNKAFWITQVSLVALKAVLDLVRKKVLTSTIAETWTQGPNLRDLDDPKPDMAFGLAFESSGPLSWKSLHSLSTASVTRLVFSPTDVENHILFPSIIYEARPDSVVITQAEDEAALAVTRALGLLGELSELSELPYQHCVVALVSSGSLWRVYVAYQDLSDDKEVHLVPVFLASLQIEKLCDRVRLMCILRRILHWMQEVYRDKVAEQVEELRRYLKKPQSESTQAS